MNARSRPLRRRKPFRLAAAAALASAIGIATAVLPISTPAALAYYCPGTNFCAWHDAGYTGTQWNYAEYAHEADTWYFVGYAANDQISSFHNGAPAYLYIAKDCLAGSQWTYVLGGYSSINLAPNKWQNGTTINDSISAYAIGARGEASPRYPAHGSRTLGGC